MDNPEIDEHGNKFWRLNGQLHRTDGPAIEWADGCQRHRTDGPAVTYPDGRKSWYLHGTSYPFDKWLDFTPGLSHEGKVMMKLTHG
jgi:hypothetical protein